MKFRHSGENVINGVCDLLSNVKPDIYNGNFKGVKSYNENEMSFFSELSYSNSKFEERVSELRNSLNKKKLVFQELSSFSLESSINEQFAIISHSFKLENNTLILEASVPDENLLIYENNFPIYQNLLNKKIPRDLL